MPVQILLRIHGSILPHTVNFTPGWEVAGSSQANSTSFQFARAEKAYIINKEKQNKKQQGAWLHDFSLELGHSIEFQS